MCSAAAAVNVLRLESYSMAGADFSQPDVSGRTALHMAVLCNEKAVLRFLLEKGVDKEIRDRLGYTAKDLAIISSSDECLKLLE